MSKTRGGNAYNPKSRRSNSHRKSEKQTNYTFFYLFKKFITKNCNQEEAKIVLCFILIISCVILLISLIINLLRGNPEALWEKAQIIQRDNSFIIEGVTKTTYIRRNGHVDSYSNNIRFYKYNNMWRSEYEDILSDFHDIFISVYDGNALHDYVNIEDKDHIGEYEPTELAINKGMIIYEQEKNAGREEPLEDIIASYNSMNQVINWYNYKYAHMSEHPRITGKKVINGYPCIYVKFSSSREACISEDYGIAIYWKNVTDESSGFSGDVNKESIIEYTVNKVKNSELDKVRIDRSLFDLPDVRPWHIYGEY